MSDHRTGHLRNTAWPAGTTRPVATPLQASVVYAAEDPDALDALYAGQVEGFSYAREGHPNAAVLAGRIDALEGMEGGLIDELGLIGENRPQRPGMTAHGAHHRLTVGDDAGGLLLRRKVARRPDEQNGGTQTDPENGFHRHDLLP